MGFGNNWNWGNKGSNFNFQKRLLQMYADCCAIPPPLPPPPPPVFNLVWWTTYDSPSGPQPDNIYNDDTGISGRQEAANYMINNYGVGGCLNTQFGQITIWCVTDVEPAFTIYDIGTASYMPHTWQSASLLYTDCFEYNDNVSDVTDYYATVVTCPPIGTLYQTVGNLPSTYFTNPAFNTDFQNELRIALGPQINTTTTIIGLNIIVKVSNNIIPLGAMTIQNSFTFATGPFVTPCVPLVGTVIWTTDYESAGGVLPDDCFQNPAGGISDWYAAAAYMQNNFTQGGQYQRPSMGLWCIAQPGFDIYELGCVTPITYFRTSLLVPPAATCYQISETPVDPLIDCFVTNMVIVGLGTIYTYMINVTIGDPGFEAVVQAAMPVYLGSQISATVDITGNTFTIKISGNILPIVSMNYYNLTTEITVLATTPCTP